MPGSQVGRASDDAVGGIGTLAGSLVKMDVPHGSAEAVDAHLRAGAVLLSVHEGAHSDVLVTLQKGNPTRAVTA